jgi:hypothetical protein
MAMAAGARPRLLLTVRRPRSPAPFLPACGNSFGIAKLISVKPK